MRERPPDVSDAELAALLRTDWQLGPVKLEHLPVGFGGYHWRAVDAAGSRWFVSAQDTAWIYGGDLAAAMQTAAALAARGLDFVVAPVATPAGELLRPLGPRYTVTVFPYHDGVPGRWGDAVSGEDEAAIAGMLAALHRVRLPAAVPVPVRGLALAARPDLDASLGERGGPWDGGPFAEPARELLTRHAVSLAAALDRFDRLADTVRADGRPLVVTHGEVHPGNLLRLGPRLLLVDWDSVGMAPPERDLWWDGTRAARYAAVTGREVSQDALALYRLRWMLDDVSLFLAEFRAQHAATADTQTSWEGLQATLADLDADRSPGRQ